MMWLTFSFYGVAYTKNSKLTSRRYMRVGLLKLKKKYYIVGIIVFLMFVLIDAPFERMTGELEGVLWWMFRYCNQLTFFFCIGNKTNYIFISHKIQ